MKSLVLAPLLSLVFASAQASLADTPARPPQFVVLAFDGSKSNSMWKETRQFARDNGIRFTYFINSVYFLENRRAREYQPPAGMAAGRSAIGFGGSANDVALRIRNVNDAVREDNEIACHAAGHFDGSRWSLADWNREFFQFFHSLFDLNTGWEIIRENFIGFRAPQLGVSPGLWTSLQQQKFEYDTSDTGRATTWPRKTAQGYWEFPLASIPIAGTAKHTLAMDYNFYVAQSPLVNGVPVDQPEKAEIYSKQMLDSYLRYFQKNYQGNRAPINIGHHFSKWNGGAYWKAMKDFALAVCHLPEVRCITYKELAAYLDGLDSATLAAYQKGAFDPMPKPAVPLASALNLSPVYDLAFVVAPDASEVRLSGADHRKLRDAGVVFTRQFEGNPKTPGRGDLTVRALLAGTEILRSTYPAETSEDDAEKDRAFRITGPSWESRALLGDLPEAHLGEED